MYKALENKTLGSDSRENEQENFNSNSKLINQMENSNSNSQETNGVLMTGAQENTAYEISCIECRNLIDEAVIKALKTGKEVFIEESDLWGSNEYKVYVSKYYIPTLDRLCYDFNLISCSNRFNEKTITIDSSNWCDDELFTGETLNEIVQMFYEDIMVVSEINNEMCEEA